MTLLESMVALVILGLTAAGFLGLFQVTSRGTGEAEVWIQAVGYAEAVMEQTKLDASASGAAGLGKLPQGFQAEVQVRPWLATEGVEWVSVTVSLPNGGELVVNRLRASR